MPVLTQDLTQPLTNEFSPEVLSGLLGAAPDLIRIADERDVVVYASGATRELLGYRPAEVEGHTVTETNHPNDADVLVGARRQALATGRTVRRTHRARQRDGGYRWLETSVRVLTTVRGRFAVLVSREASTHHVGMRSPASPEASFPAAGDAWAIPNTSEAGDLARHLTDREGQVLRGLAEGMSVSSLAERYHLRESTLRGHVKSILQKLQVHSQLQAVLVGMRAGVIPEVVQDADPVTQWQRS